MNGSCVRDRALVRGRPIVVSPHEVLQLGTVMAIVQPGGDERAPTVQRRANAMRPPAADSPAAQPGARSPAMHSLHHLLERIAPSELSVLITGETGVGKEVAAQLLHRPSPRAQRPFPGINCAALAEPPLES